MQYYFIQGHNFHINLRQQVFHIWLILKVKMIFDYTIMIAFLNQYIQFYQTLNQHLCQTILEIQNSASVIVFLR